MKKSALNLRSLIPAACLVALASLLSLWHAGTWAPGLTPGEINILTIGKQLDVAMKLTALPSILLKSDPFFALFSRGLYALPNHVATVRLVEGLMLVVSLLLWTSLLSRWTSRRTAVMSTLASLAIPAVIMLPRINPGLTYTALLMTAAMLLFDSATRADKPTWRYAVCGVLLAISWIHAPVAITIIVGSGGLLMLASKPRLFMHISRQASLSFIVMLVILAAVVTPAIKFGWELPRALADRLNQLGGFHASLRSLSELASGPHDFSRGLPNTGWLPLSLWLLAGIGLWRLIDQITRPRNLVLILWPILLLLVATQTTGITQGLLYWLGFLLLAIWIATAFDFLFRAWLYVFPNNKLAKPIAAAVISICLAGAYVYTFWYAYVAWYGSPEVYAAYDPNPIAISRVLSQQNTTKSIAVLVEPKQLPAMKALAPNNVTVATAQDALLQDRVIVIGEADTIRKNFPKLKPTLYTIEQGEVTVHIASGEVTK